MRNLRRAASTACFLATLIVCSCARNRAAARANDGGTVSDLVFQRLGKVVPGKQNAGKNSEDRIDGKPIVATGLKGFPFQRNHRSPGTTLA